jgi:hypothetical protein
MFHWRYTSAGGVTKDIIRPVFSVSLEIYLCWWSHRGYHPPLVESSRIRPVVSVSLEIYLCWWSHRGYHPPSSQCFTGDIPLLVESPRISSSAGGVIEDPTSSQCFTGDIPLLVESPRISSAQ